MNVLDYPWQDVAAAAGAVRLNSLEKTESKGSLESEEARAPQASASDNRGAGERSSVLENVGDAVRKVQVGANARVKKSKESYNRGE